MFSDIFLVVDDVRGYPAILLQPLLSRTSHGSYWTGFRRVIVLPGSDERLTHRRSYWILHLRTGKQLSMIRILTTDEEVC